MCYHLVCFVKLGIILTLIAYTATIFPLILTILMPHSSESCPSFHLQSSRKKIMRKKKKKTAMLPYSLTRSSSSDAVPFKMSKIND